MTPMTAAESYEQAVRALPLRLRQEALSLTEAERLIAATAETLSEGNTVYYTGHCTGDRAYARLKEALGDRLRPMDCGAAAEL